MMFQKLLRGFGMLFFWINAVLLTLWNCHWRSYEISSLCLFICVEFFSKVVHRKLLKRWGSWVFGKKLWFMVVSIKWTQNNFKIRFLMFHEKLMHEIFLIFGMELQQQKVLKLTWVIILGKSYFEFCRL